MFFITGMHRSGTSCVAGTLEACGLSLGASRKVSRHAFLHNARGQFENLDMLRINEAIFRETRRSWHSPPGRSEVAACPATRTIRQFCADFDGEVAKDPRTTVLIDSYIRLCPSLTGIVHCFRHPLAVAQSLQRRNGFSMQSGLTLWLYYNEYLLMHAAGFPVLFVNFHDLLAAPSPQLQRMLDYLGRGQATPEAFGFIDTKLNHFDDDAANDELMDHDLAYTYGRLLDRTR